MGVIKGKAYWASVVKPNTNFHVDGIWSIDVCNLDARNKKIAKADGLNVKNKGDERGDFIHFLRKAKLKDGSFNTPPIIIDSQKNVLSETNIGNGSLVNVAYSKYEYEFLKYKGVAADLLSVQVLDLVPYDAYNPSEWEVVSDDDISRLGFDDNDLTFSHGNETKQKKEKEMTKKIEDLPIVEEDENNFKIKKGAFGYIYCITNDSWKNWVKVGMTTGLKARLSGFNSCNPTECTVVDYHLIDRLLFNEHEVHKHFNKFVKKKKRKEKISSSNTTSLEWHNVSVAEAKELFTSAIQIIKDKHLEEQLT
jgi:hypothetical protein